MPIPNTRGVRKVNENIVSEGRSLVFTEEDASKYNWDEIPAGAIKINPQTGVMYVKLQDVLVLKDGRQVHNAYVLNNKVYKVIDNLVDHSTGAGLEAVLKSDGSGKQVDMSEAEFNSQTDWVPAFIRHDGTLSIAKDNKINNEIFTVTEVNKSNKTFRYRNRFGQIRNSYLTNEGYFVFELEEGTYQMYRNHLQVYIDDVLFRNAISNGILEIDDKRFAILDDLVIDQEVTVIYNDIVRIGNPYPRIFLQPDEPSKSEIGDLWIDNDADIEEDTIVEQIYTGLLNTVSWEKITGTPTSLLGYGIQDRYSFEGHTHQWSSLLNVPTTFKASGGNSDTVGGYYPGNSPNRIPILDSNGKIPLSTLPLNSLQAIGIYIGPTSPSNPVEKTIWIKTTAGDRKIVVYTGGGWIDIK